MKKILLFIALFCILYSGYSQSQRFVFFEEFTNASCGPCAAQNPAFDALLTTNASKCTSVKYHTNWPGVDPMNAQNPGDAAARVSYYGVTGVPYAVMDGSPQTGANYLGAPANVTQSKIDAEYLVPSPFEVQLQHNLSAGQDSVYSTMLVKCTQNVAGNLVAHNIIIEKHIHFTSAPGTNGEKDFYNVMKKILPTSAGTTMPIYMEAGDYVLIECSWKFATVYDKTQIAAVGFVQDKNTKQVFQSANSSTNPLVLPYNTDLQVMDVLNVLPKTCKTKISPSVKIRNNGNNPITSMTIKYKVNDGTLSTFTWNGSLASMQKIVVPLPEYTYDLLAQNTLTIYTTSPNSTADQYPKNDTLQYNFTTSSISTDQVKVAIRTDNLPQETTWEIKNSLGVAIASGGPYTDPNKLFQQTITLPQADCYSFVIYDAGGNGICCTNGNGGYEISSNGTTIKQGGSFGYSESCEFLMEAPLTVAEISNTPLIVYPNPLDGSAKVSFYLRNSNEVKMNIYSAFGQLVTTRSLGTLNAGQHETILDGQNLMPGVYILQLNTGSEVYSRKVSVVR